MGTESITTLLGRIWDCLIIKHRQKRQELTELNKQNPMKDLIVKAAIHADKESNFERYVINQLGKRFEKLTIHNEKDCTKIKQKAWIERELWREINDILRINGFSWLSNGEDSCWIKMSTGQN